MNQPVMPFDDHIPARTLLPEKDRALLERLFIRLVCDDTRLSYERLDPADAEVSHDLETVAWVSGMDRDLASAAADLVGLFCSCNARYLMASRMHKRVVDLDYEELKRKNADLEQSRERYKALSETLEQKVEEQVGKIETARRQAYIRERLSTIGQLASGMAHEINNPLGYIINNLRAGERYLKEIGCGEVSADEKDEILEDFNALLQESLQGAERVSAIVGDLKRFSDIDNVTPARTINLVELMQSAIRMVGASHTGAAGLIKLAAPESLKVNGHAGHVSQAFFNVLENAVLACIEGGDITVSMVQEEQSVLVHIDDSGCGIPPELRERVFEPFFTTRKVGEGAGLGLSSARDIIQAHEGSIEVWPGQDGGTSVLIVLPSTERN